MAKMTKNQALDKLDKAVGKVAEAGLKRIEVNLPKLKASAKKLADQLKADESPDLIDTQIRHLKLQMRGVSEGTTLLDEAVRRLKEFEKDDELFELLADEMTEAMGYATKPLEGARKELAKREEAARPAVKAGEQHAGDSKQAREEWAEAVAEVDRLVAGCAKEIKAWEEWDKVAAAAAAKRDPKALAQLQKAKPASASLDAVARQPEGMAFKAFEKEFKTDTLALTRGDQARRTSIAPGSSRTAARQGRDRGPGRRPEGRPARRRQGADRARPAGQRQGQGPGRAGRPRGGARQEPGGHRQGLQGAPGRGRCAGQAEEGRRDLNAGMRPQPAGSAARASSSSRR